MQLNQFFYRNAMEPLVAEEVERQLQQLPPKLVPYINSVQVFAYALNQFPALYATSESGWHYQQQKAQQFAPQIIIAVRRGLAAVGRDPLRLASIVIVAEANAVSQSQQVSEMSLSKTC